ncbi:MAG: VTT domain-containing protein [Halobacteria archaeon]|nr:VTT domain-containing protein [Halobacteria archaeon]
MIQEFVLLSLSEYPALNGFLRSAVETATGWFGVAMIGIYSFLIAVVLPMPSEVVLAPVNTLDIGLGRLGTLGTIIVVSAVGKAAGSVAALHLGIKARESGPVTRFFQRRGYDPVEWSHKKGVEVAKEWGYVGMAVLLSVPFFPDTISIYAFAVLEDSYSKFAAAAFVGSVGRLLVTLGILGGGSLLI